MLRSRVRSQNPRPSQARRSRQTSTIDVTVHEGTSMSVAISPDGRTLATDMQGSIWTMPAAGGAMTRITDVFNDARQPMWSPDGRTIVFFAYRDGGYDIWAINPDGSNQRKLTWGTFDDREPIFSHDGTRIAFSSDRGNALGSDYNIWMLDLRNGELKQITKSAERRLHAQLVARRQRDRLRHVAGQLRIGLGHERAIAGDRRVRSVKGARLDAPSWGPGGQLLYHVTAGSRRASRSTASRSPAPRTCLRSARRGPRTAEYVYVSDGKIRRRSVAGLPMQTVDFTATMPVIQPEYTHRVRDFTSTTPRKALGHRAAGDFARRQADRVCGGRRHLRHAGHGGAAVNLTKDVALDTDPAWSPDGSSLVYSSDKDSPHLQLWIRDMKSGAEPQGHQHHHAAAGRVVLARRQAHRVLQRRRHVARRRDVGPRSRLGPHHQDSRLAAAAGHADLVAGRQAHRARRHRADDRALPRGHQPGADDRGHRRRREVVRADPDAVDRFARRRRAGVVARRHQDGGDLRRRAGGVAGRGDRRAARPAAPRHVGERALAELAGRFAAHPLSVARSAAHRRHRDRRDRRRCRSI